MAVDKIAIAQEVGGDTALAETELKPVGGACAPEKLNRRGRPKGSMNKGAVVHWDRVATIVVIGRRSCLRHRSSKRGLTLTSEATALPCATACAIAPLVHRRW